MKTRKCSIELCDNKHFGRGFCSKHYQRWVTHGDPSQVDVVMHGMSKTKEHSSWRHMRERCMDTNHKHYDRYGGRGVTVCDSWANSFMSFYEDMGDMPRNGMQIDRINNDGNYEPSNCRWATPKENARNTSSVVLNKYIISVAKDLRKNGFRYSNIGYILNVNKTTIREAITGKTWGN